MGVELLQLLVKLFNLLVRFFQHVVDISQTLLVCGDLRRGERRRDLRIFDNLLKSKDLKA